ncbi:ribosomal protein L24 [Aeromicrobium marinum DSM 15272]|uniref:Large ribosomal subunit protein uL24 n=1 Tax=Aeromicrobium marinum DSM 15272 TaxID=585531 RepID=E2SG79_9ACTN|nr:50S ribosomal protein L24 [Aeromicrobium marinum]EFQ81836.1 ribosomal protein L24 [Aeromicrobium marinum DSM 15272]
MTKKNLTIRKGDQVKVIAGNDKGVEGKVIEVLAEADRVIVEGVNRVKKHTRASAAGGVNSGGIITVEAPIHVSNVMLVADGTDGKTTTRIGFRRDEITKTRPDGSTYPAHRSVRIARKTGEEI